MAELTLQRLRYFVAVAHAGTYRQAADRLHVSQPAVSAQVHALENDVGVRLFENAGRGVRLSPAGRQLLPKAAEILGAVEGLVEFAGGISRGDEGCIRLTCFPIHIDMFLGELARDFLRENPRAAIDWTRVRDDRRQSGGRKMFQELAEGDVDVVVGRPQRGLGGLPVYDAKIVAVLPDDHEHRNDRVLDVRALREEGLLMAPSGFFSRQVFEEACAALGFEVRVRHEMSRSATLQTLGRCGFGIPVVANDTLTTKPVINYPVLVDADGSELGTPVWLQWRSDAASPLTMRFVSFARGWLKRHPVRI